MKKVLKKGGFGLLGLLLLLVLISFLLPRNFHIEQSNTIDAPVSIVFDQVNDLRNWEKWSPWKKIDPLMEMTFSNPPEGEGAHYNWESENEQLGKGKLTLAEVQPNKKIVTAMSFGGDDEASAIFSFDNAKGGDTEVTWSMDIDVGMAPWSKYRALMMKGLMNKQFKIGLDGIKEASENR